MKISEIMTPVVILANENATILQAATKMKDLDVGCLVVESNGSVAGVLTDRDVVLRAVAAKKDLSTTKVKEIFTTNPVICDSDESIDQAADLFSKHKIRRLLVKDKSGDIVGMVSLGDLAIQSDDAEMVAAVFRRISGSGREENFHMRKSAPESTEHVPIH